MEFVALYFGICSMYAKMSTQIVGALKLNFQRPTYNIGPQRQVIMQVSP